MRRSSTFAIALVAAVALAAPARAWDPATTHAGLTERAGFASRLSTVLRESYRRPLGLYETLSLSVPGPRGARLVSLLRLLDGAQGYQPLDGRRLPAFEWLVAGSVLEEVPVGRLRNHYYDPTTKRGLDEGGFFGGLDRRIHGVEDGTAPVRDVFTGGALDTPGSPSVAWLTAKDNELSLERFLDARERAVGAATPAERDGALAEALLTAGALLHVIEDAGEPALVRGDLVHELGGDQLPLRRWVADRYGRLDLPDPKPESPSVAHLADLITNAAGDGLADRTNKRFFSLGTLPGMADAHALPSVSAGPGASGHVAGGGIAHLAAWRRDREGRVQWLLDEPCYEDYANALLPDVAATATTALDHLFRGALAIDETEVKAGALALGAGRIAFFAEDAAGRRREIGQKTITHVDADASISPLPDAVALEGARRLAVVFRGVDGNGEPIVLSIEKPLAAQ